MKGAASTRVVRRMKLENILETCLYVDDLEKAQAFYEQVLGLPFYSAVAGRHVFFKLNNGMFLLFDPKATREKGDLPAHGDGGPGHAAFRVAPEDIPRWRKHLADARVEIETEHIWPNGVPSIYFRDPAGNVLEITTAALWGYDLDA